MADPQATAAALVALDRIGAASVLEEAVVELGHSELTQGELQQLAFQQISGASPYFDTAQLRAFLDSVDVDQLVARAQWLGEQPTNEDCAITREHLEAQRELAGHCWKPFLLNGAGVFGASSAALGILPPVIRSTTLAEEMKIDSHPPVVELSDEELRVWGERQLALHDLFYAAGEAWDVGDTDGALRMLTEFADQVGLPEDALAGQTSYERMVETLCCYPETADTIAAGETWHYVRGETFEAELLEPLKPHQRVTVPAFRRWYLLYQAGPGGWERRRQASTPPHTPRACCARRGRSRALRRQRTRRTRGSPSKSSDPDLAAARWGGHWFGGPAAVVKTRLR